MTASEFKTRIYSEEAVGLKGRANSRVYGVWTSLRELGFPPNGKINRLIRDFRNDRQSLGTVFLKDFQHLPVE